MNGQCCMRLYLFSGMGDRPQPSFSRPLETFFANFPPRHQLCSFHGSSSGFYVCQLSSRYRQGVCKHRVLSDHLLEYTRIALGTWRKPRSNPITLTLAQILFQWRI